MKCNCANLPEVFFIPEGPEGFDKGLKRIDGANWQILYECPECGTLWIIDAWDIMNKNDWQAAYRIHNRYDWPTIIPIEKRKQLLLESRGGTTDNECVWKDCHKKQVKGVLLCINHLFESGARR